MRLCLLLLASIFGYVHAQQIQGSLLDDEGGEPITNALISLSFADSTQQVIYSNDFGQWSSQGALPARVRFSFVGYESIDTVLLDDQNHVIRMQTSNFLPSVVITEVPAQKEIENGILHLPVSRLGQIPTVMGEADLLKSITLLPGIQSGLEGSSQFSVRGGDLGENLILLDGIPMYNAYHYFGFLSIFNSETIKDFKVYKGNFPARHGGRVSSVLEMTLREGSRDTTKGSFQVGLTTSSFTLSGPLKNKKTTYMVGVRTTYLGLVTWPMRLLYDANQIDYSFGLFVNDTYGKLTHHFDNGAKLQFSLYTGMDIIDIRSRFEFLSDNEEVDVNLGWGNLATRIRYSYPLWGGFWKTGISYNRYLYKFNTENIVEEERYQSNIQNGISEWNFNSEVELPVSSYFNFYAGVNVKRQTFELGFTEQFVDEVDSRSERIGQAELAWYSNLQFNYKSIKLDAGLRGVNYSFRNSESSFSSLEPRVNLQFKPSARWSFYGSYNRTSQNMFLLQSVLYQANDLWLPLSPESGLPIGEQWSVGVH